MRISKKELRELCKALDAWVGVSYSLGQAHGRADLNQTEAESAYDTAHLSVLKRLGITVTEWYEVWTDDAEVETLPLKLDCKCRAKHCEDCRVSSRWWRSDD